MVTTPAASPEQSTLKQKKRATLAYRMLVIFTLLYYLRPQDLIPGLSSVPLEKIAGGLALVALFTGLAAGRTKAKLPVEIKLLLLLLADLCLTIPFAYWRGGAFKVVFQQFGKSVIAALLIALVVESFF